jgi:hypothetical protein
VRLDLTPAWAAFIELHNRRQFGLDANPLAYSDIAAYLDVNRINDAQAREELAGYVVFLDNTWLKLYLNDPKRKREEKKARGAGKKR